MVIGAPMPSFADKWLTYLYDGIRKFDEENADVEIKLTDANEDPARMLNDVDNFIDAGVDALLVVPTDVATVKPIAKKAKRAGIPLIIVNRLPDEKTMKNVTSYVGSESIQAGILQAEQVVKLLDGKDARVAIMMGVLGHEAQVQRTEGNKQVFAKHDNIKIITEQEGRWDRAKGIQLAEDWLQSDKDINVIVANNDEMAIGALLAANKAGLKDEDLIIAGIDATPDALEFLGQGLDITVFQSASGQGYGGAKVAYKAAKGEKVEKYEWINFELVGVDQKDEYKAKY
jgi:inositol transport system substrate-binding protein